MYSDCKLSLSLLQAATCLSPSPQPSSQCSGSRSPDAVVPSQEGGCCVRDHVSWHFVCSLALQSLESTSPDACSRARLLPAVTIRGHGSNVGIRKMMVSYSYVHPWCPKHDSTNPDGERELAGVGYSCKSRRRQKSEMTWQRRGG